ncbi:MAG: hypothetical protein GX862_00230 [Leucobacter sp.]|jgi:hypothetical protein|nr:hypothetical protein [Leucobacter sp.]
MHTSRTPLAIVTGLALILAPLIGWAFKLISIGWFVVIVMFGPIVLLVAGYIVQIIIASQGFLSRRPLFGARQRLATIAAWLTSVAVVLLGIVMPDGGDAYYGSTLQLWLGAYGPNGDAVHQATTGLNDTLFVICTLVWLGGFVWLVVEWVIALVRRSRERKAAA